MVDSISRTKDVRQAGSATARYGSPPAPAQPAVASKPVLPSPGSSQSEDGSPDERGAEQTESTLRLEITEGENGEELIYRFIDARTGEVVREWDAGEFGKLRDYARSRNIHLLDTKV